MKLHVQLEQDAIKMLIQSCGDKNKQGILTKQLQYATVVSRYFSGSGFFTTYSIDEKTERITERESDVIDTSVSGVVICDAGEIEVGFILFLENGAIDTLECFQWSESAPMNGIKHYELFLSKPQA